MRISWRIIMLLVVALGAAPLRADVRVMGMIEDDRPYVGSDVRYTIVVEGSHRNATIPDFPQIDDVQVGPPSTHRETTIEFVSVNGRRRQVEKRSLIIQYKLIPLAPGEHTIPAIEVLVDGIRYTTDPVVFVAREAQASLDARLVVEIERDTVFIGEPVPIRFLWLFNGGRPVSLEGFVPSDRLRLYEPREPRWLVETGGQGVNNMPFLDGETVAGLTQDVERDGVLYDSAIIIDRILVPQRPGEVLLGPFTLLYETDAFGTRNRFGQRRREVVRSDALTLRVLPLPADGRPPSFNGLVGRAQMHAASDETHVKVGDPITLHLTIACDEPVERVRPPGLDSQNNAWEAFQLSPEQWELEETTPTSTTWRTIVRARRENIDAIPPIELGYFDPQTGTYAIARTDAIPLEVEATRVVTSTDVLAGPMPSLGPIPEAAPLEDQYASILNNSTGPALLEGESMREAWEFLRSPLGLILILGPPMIYAALAIVLITRDRMASPASRRRHALRRALRALAGDAREHDRVIDAIRTYLGERFCKQVGTITPLDCRRLLSAEIDEALAGELADLLTQAERGVFDAPGNDTPAPPIERTRELLQRVDAAPVRQATETPT